MNYANLGSQLDLKEAQVKAIMRLIVDTVIALALSQQFEMIKLGAAPLGSIKIAARDLSFEQSKFSTSESITLQSSKYKKTPSTLTKSKSTSDFAAVR